MKITKLGHSCLLVQMPAPVGRTVLFDPGVYSMVDVKSLRYLDDVLITHQHNDHMDIDLIKQLQKKFPDLRVTAPADAIDALKQAGIAKASSTSPEGVRFFSAPHHVIKPLFPADPPDENGMHYLEMLSHPGDSHSFQETMPILALPVSAPWGSTLAAARLALKLRPKYIIPVHDWHWHDEAREQMYDGLEKCFAEAGITFLKIKNGQPIVVNV